MKKQVQQSPGKETPSCINHVDAMFQLVTEASIPTRSTFRRGSADFWILILLFGTCWHLFWSMSSLSASTCVFVHPCAVLSSTQICQRRQLENIKSEAWRVRSFSHVEGVSRSLDLGHCWRVRRQAPTRIMR